MSRGSELARSLAGARCALLVLGLAALGACQAAAPVASPLRAQDTIAHADFAALVERISEDGGYFDTDNLISNEAGYLNVIDALRRELIHGGAYVGVGPDQNFSYIAEIRPDVAFITDIRRDNLLQHLLLKALIERSATPAEYLSALHGVPPPEETAAWQELDIGDVVVFVDAGTRLRTPAREVFVADLHEDVADRIAGYGLALTVGDYTTIRRFHDAFIRSGLDLRFTSFGRPPRPHYPSYRQLVLETDVDGDRASWLSTPERYDVVRALHLANRIVPVVGDLAGPTAMRAMGDVMRELGVELMAFYTSNVEFYLWQARAFDDWLDNLSSLPVADDAVVIRSYFPNFGSGHPSAIAGYYATQTLQPVATLRAGGFASYWDVVTRDAISLR